MNKVLKDVLIAVVVITALFFAYRLLFIRVVNYEIAGIEIPSRYNILTGKVTPLENYDTAAGLPKVEKPQSKNIGLSREQVAIAKLRWSIFEEWVKAKPEYKGWQNNAETFKRAHDAFKKMLEGYSGKKR